VKLTVKGKKVQFLFIRWRSGLQLAQNDAEAEYVPLLGAPWRGMAAKNLWGFPQAFFQQKNKKRNHRI
jgi:hypothetical protein